MSRRPVPRKRDARPCGLPAQKAAPQPSLATRIGLAVEDIASGGRGDFVVFGPLQMCTAATPGALIYTKDTTDDGEVAETAGTKDCIVGVAESATVVFVNPQMIDLT